jgi:hypothetical protein
MEKYHFVGVVSAGVKSPPIEDSIPFPETGGKNKAGDK